VRGKRLFASINVYDAGQEASMKVGDTGVDADSTRQKLWYRVGAIAAVALAIGYISTIPLYAHVGPPPIGGDA
jgi:hypothetical protein